MSASSWDRAVEAAAKALRNRIGFSTDHWWHTQLASECLAAALPVLMAELAQRIEDSLSPLTDVRPYEGGYNCCGCSTYDQIIEDAAKLVREFAAEVTKKAGP